MVWPRRLLLYVEDNDVNALVMQALFDRPPDLQLQVAPSCAAALCSVRMQRPDSLLLDLRLPDGHGCELLPRLLALPGMHRVPAVAVSAEHLPAFTLHGFDEQWPKPMNLAYVLDRLDHWLPAPIGRPLQAAPAPQGWPAPPSGVARG